VLFSVEYFRNSSVFFFMELKSPFLLETRDCTLSWISTSCYVRHSLKKKRILTYSTQTSMSNVSVLRIFPFASKNMKSLHQPSLCFLSKYTQNNKHNSRSQFSETDSLVSFTVSQMIDILPAFCGHITMSTKTAAGPCRESQYTIDILVSYSL
jgi:hypothetical protein